MFSLALLNNDNILSGNDDRTVNVWNAETFELIYVLRTGHLGVIDKVIVWQIEKLFVTAASDSTIKLWNQLTFKIGATLTGHSNEVITLNVLQNGNLISSSLDSTMIMWQKTKLSTNLKRTLNKHNGLINALSLINNEKQLVS